MSTILRTPFAMRACPLWDGSSLYGADGSSIDPQITIPLIYEGAGAGPLLASPGAFTAKTRSAIGPCVSPAASSSIASTLLGSGLTSITQNQPSFSMPVFAPVVGAGNYQIALDPGKFQKWLRAKQWGATGSITGGGATVDFSGTMDNDFSLSSLTDSQLKAWLMTNESLWKFGGHNNIAASAGGGSGPLFYDAESNPFLPFYNYGETGVIDDDSGHSYGFAFCKDFARQQNDPTVSARFYPGIRCAINLIYLISTTGPVITTPTGGTQEVTTWKYLVVCLDSSQTLEGNYVLVGGVSSGLSSPPDGTDNMNVPISQIPVTVDGESLNLNGIAKVITMTDTEFIPGPPDFGAATHTFSYSASDADVDLAFAGSQFLTEGGLFDGDTGNYV